MNGKASSDDVLRSLDSVIDTIFAALSPTPTHCPFPQAGGEELRLHG